MLQESFKLYTKQCLDIGRSLIIKSQLDAELMNERLAMFGYVVGHDPATWRYYMHLAGEYHEADQPMVILSRDTQQLISFDKETLKDHPITLLSFESYKDELISKYPKQIHLIRGIVKPIDKTAAIAARDFQILHYDKRKIDFNEGYLIPELQKALYRFVTRNYNKDNVIVGKLYGARFWFEIAVMLASEIMTLRLSKVNTREACQFYVWEYLSGFYNLGKYKPYITVGTSLWLYRNMSWIQQNAGKESTLDELIKHITKPGGLKAYQYEGINKEITFRDSGQFESSFVKYANDQEQYTYGADALLDESNIIYETINEGKDNPKDFDSDVLTLTNKMKYERNNKLPAGLLKFDLDSDLASELINDIQSRTDYWVWLSSLGLYTGTFKIQIPGESIVLLSAKDALILFIYAANAGIGRAPLTIPSINVKNVIPTTYPSPTEIISKNVPVLDLDDGLTAYEDLVSLKTVSTALELEKFVEQVLNRRLLHDCQIANELDMKRRGHLTDAINGIYSWQDIELAPANTRYDEWLSNNNINKYSISETDWRELAFTVLMTMTGIDPDDMGIPKSRRALMEIVDMLTSYDLTIVEGNGEGARQALPYTFPVIHDPAAEEVSESWLNVQPACPLTQVFPSTTDMVAADLHVNGLLLFNVGANTDEVILPVGYTVLTTNEGESTAMLSLTTPYISEFKITNL